MKSPAKSFQDLLVWKKAHQSVLSIYGLTKKFPASERYGLTFQLRRSAVSIPANIAEGFRKKGKLDKVRFLNIAQGSLEESRYYLILFQDLEYCNSDLQLEQLEEVSKMLDADSKSILTSDSCLLSS
ncbi:MAG: four helix bundle protein [Candidatus Glassbacteria bacterium RIFCSPLOWO2_12_FULL_58_11]|uniref:Four helix bundle protein n=1 Tax=Candidatus Glassbacteria bacterium RIFCSPLOWO2_12_FULL_58_11 TaxID=1817867 RepID=A0A1F5YUH9_9BACT|nr:MAG: four helix bundle protein [Candidatus Glassbacteria bacterium RIFCSPLOWO2_12_FULL_58_11]